MKLVFEAILKHGNQMGSEERQLYSNRRKAYERLEKVHTASEWSEVPMPPLSDYRDHLKRFDSHTARLLNSQDEEAEFTITIRPFH